MFEATSGYSEISACVVLSGFARNALQAFRLPKYSALAELFGDPVRLCVLLDVMNGFRAQFGAPETRPGVTLSVLDLEEWVLYKIDECLCPLDETYINEVLYAMKEETLLCGPVPIQTFGIPWEMVQVYQKSGDREWACLMPLLALGYRSLPANDEVGDALLLCEEALQDRAMEMGGELPPMNPYDILTRLQELPAPIGPGLAAGWKMMWRGSGNLFLDTLAAEYMGDYGEFFFDVVGDNSFSVHDLKALEREWREAKPEVDAFADYQGWYDDEFFAEARVVDELIGLFGDMLGVDDDDE
ncbi:MAG: hypothetical protein JXR84_04290 [Anaerolineae bacterium]|nr:hypothetical protein [Anaerolineae bacterium]